MDTPTDRHNAVLLPALKLIAEGNNEAQCWVVLESLCLGIGKLYQRTPRQTAVFVENIAERLMEGKRA